MKLARIALDLAQLLFWGLTVRRADLPRLGA